MNKNVLISGVLGQDGSYLAELCVEKGWTVHGISKPNPSRRSKETLKDLEKLGSKLSFHEVEIQDSQAVERVVSEIKPSRVFHLAAFHTSLATMKGFGPGENAHLYSVNTLGALNLLSSLKEHVPTSRYIQASSCLIHEGATISPQNEETPPTPRCLYAYAKIAASDIARHFREEYGMWTGTAVLYNHESPRRAENFLSRRVVRGLIDVKEGKTKKLRLANLSGRKDWAWAPDVVAGMYLMSEENKPGDFVFASGQSHTVKDWVVFCAEYLGLRPWSDYVETGEEEETSFSSAAELRGDTRKAEQVLSWKVTHDFEKMVHMMVDSELELRKRTPKQEENRI